MSVRVPRALFSAPTSELMSGRLDLRLKWIRSKLINFGTLLPYIHKSARLGLSALIGDRELLLKGTKR